jgi:hypothetical protein
MVEIYPKLTPAKLKKSARKTSEGKGIAPLPGVRTDAKLAAAADTTNPKSPYYGSKHHDPKGYQKNRELAERIGKAMGELKQGDEHGPRFVLAWRMYPNEEHPSWHRKDVHFCGCGCGCFARGASKRPSKTKGTEKTSKGVGKKKK